MAAKPVAERIAQAEARVERAKVRRERASKKLWSLLGWGESDKVEAARKAVTAANQDLVAAQTHLSRLLRSNEATELETKNCT